MKLRKFLQIASFGLLVYLLADSFMQIDIAVSKNDSLTNMRKMAVDSIQSINQVKQKAKDYLDTIRLQYKEHSSESIIRFRVLLGLIIIQMFLFASKGYKTVE